MILQIMNFPPDLFFRGREMGFYELVRWSMDSMAVDFTKKDKNQCKFSENLFMN